MPIIMRFSTLEAICAYLDCQPGEILEFEPPGEGDAAEPALEKAG